MKVSEEKGKRERVKMETWIGFLTPGTAAAPPHIPLLFITLASHSTYAK